MTDSDESFAWYAVVRDGAGIRKPDQWVRLRTTFNEAEARTYIAQHALELDRSVFVVGVMACYPKPKSMFPKAHASEPIF